MRARTWVLVVGVVSALLLASGSGAFSSVSADRSVSVAVVADDAALLGIDHDRVTLANGQHDDVVLVRLTNRFSGAIEHVEVTVTEPGAKPGTPPNLKDLTTPDSISPGESRPVTADVVCSAAEGNTEEWLVTVDIEGEGFSASLTRTVVVECTGDPPADGSSNGNPSAGNSSTGGASNASA